jgi:hypothetical protein
VQLHVHSRAGHAGEPDPPVACLWQSAGDMNVDQIAALLKDPMLWLILLLAFALGALGALTHRVAQPPTADPSAKRSSWWADSLIGGIAAIAMVYVSNAALTTGMAFVVGSLIAGYAGKAVLDGLEAKTTATIAERDASEKTADLSKLVTTVEDMPADGATVNHAQAIARNLKIKHGLT